MKAIDRFQRFNKKIYNSQDILKNHILDKYPIHYTDNVDNLSQVEKYAEQSDYVWLIDKNIELYRSFPLWLKIQKNKNHMYMFPYVYKKSKRVMSWKKVQLVPTKVTDPKKITLSHICGEYDVYMGKNFFDVFFIGNKETGTWDNLINKFPHAIAVDSYQDAIRNSQTDMFWVVWDDLIIDDRFNFNYVPDEWSFKYPHVFANNDIEQFDGICLMPKNYIPTDKEIEYRFFVSKKQVRQIASKTRNYDIFKINNYDDYKTAIKETRTSMFWGVPDDVELLESFKFDLNFEFTNKFDREITHVFKNDKNYDGIALFSTTKKITEEELKNRNYTSKKEWDIVASKPKPYEIFTTDTYEDYLNALKKTKTNMFWGIPSDVTVKKNFDFSKFYFEYHNLIDRQFVHVFKNSEHYDGVALFPTEYRITSKELKNRFYVNKKEWNIIASTPKPYDKFIINTYEDYITAVESTTTEMFWGIPSDIIVDKKFKFNLYVSQYDLYDRNTTHVMKNGDFNDGIVLFSKNSLVSKKEIETRFYVNKKDWNIIASIPKPYDLFEIDSYDEYLSALETSTTEMFWMSSRNIEVDKELINTFYISHHNTVDRNQNHAFEHKVNVDILYNGLLLVSKNKILTEQEVEHRFPIERKEWNIVGSSAKKYDVFEIYTYDNYQSALEKSTTEMFWGKLRPISIKNESVFDIYFTHDNKYDRTQNHAFLHQVNDKLTYDGLYLFSKHTPVSKKEIEHKHIVEHKEWNIIASGSKLYDRFEIDNYKEYLAALENSSTEMFWMIPPETNISKDFKFDLYFDDRDDSRVYERSMNHVFKNGKAYDGISLLSKKTKITEREIDMRYFTDKISHEIVASIPRSYDVVFISNKEEFSDQNYEKLLLKFPQAKRISNVKGIHQAHIAAAKLCETEMFWVVDGDAEIIDNFNFDYYVPKYDPDSKKTVHVWKSLNPINGLIYGYGAAKLLPRQLTLNMDITKPDMTTSISPLFKSVNRVSNVTRFNTDELTTWRSAFRECVKLSSKIIQGQNDEETEFRLNAWCTRGKDKEFGLACLAGATAGKAYGLKHAGDVEALRMINNFEWLEDQFKLSYQST